MSKTIRAFSIVLTLGIVLASTTLALAQSTGNATLRGTVKDPQGALIRDAVVTVVNEATRDDRKAKSNDAGVFVFSALIPGTYTVRIEAQGFKTSEQKGITLSPSDTKGVEFPMEIGAPSETVTVTASAVALQTETGAKENVITSAQIENLSIISRSSLELLRILPGVVAPDQSGLESISFGGGANANSQYFVNGIRGENNTVTVDGSRMMDIGSNNGTIITANPDMVKEVKVQTSNYAAEHGSAAVQILASTKSGTSGFHGSLYDYWRPYQVAANDRSNSINGIQRPKGQFNYPGGNIGGPIYIPGKWNKNKDKLFFFTGFEYYYQRVDEGSTLSVVPTLKQRAGDFSELLTGTATKPFLNQGRTVNVPLGCNAPGYVVGQPAPNNNLKPCLDPSNTGVALINLYPQPNFNDPNGRYNYVYSVLRVTDRNQWIGRFDYNVSDRTKLYVRLAREFEDLGFPRGLWWNSSAYEVPGKLSGTNLGRSVVVNLTNIISPTMTNEVLFSGSKLNLDNTYADPDKVSLKALNIPPFGFFKNSSPFAPVGVIDAWGGGIGGDLLTAYGYPIIAHNDSFSITDNLTKVVNSHTLRFGAFIEQANKKQQSNSDINIEMFQWGQPNGTGNNYGDLIVGRPGQVTMGTDRPLDHFRYYNYEFYAQDQWKVRPSFTLEYGLRVAYMPNNFERGGLGVLFDPAAYNKSQGLFINGDRTKPNGILTAKSGAIPLGLTDSPPVSWMPRLNFAWDVGGKGDLVIRAGGGLFYNRVQGNYDYYSSGVMPNTYRATATPWSLPDGLTFATLKNVDPFGAISNVSINSRNSESIAHPRIANMSFTIEKRLPWENVATVAYVGTQGRHLPQQRQVNFVAEGRLLSGTVNGIDLSVPINRAALDQSVINTFKPFPAYTGIGYYQFTGTSTYHSLQATLSRQTSKNLQYFLTYTFGKALGTTAVNESDGANWADPIDTRGRSWGVLPYDRTHIFNASYNWYIPNGARGSLDNAVMRGILNGWQMSGITTFSSGVPIRLRFTGDIASTQAALGWYGTDAYSNQPASTGAIAPIFTRDPRLNDSDVGGKWLDIGAIQIPGFGQSGPHQSPYYIRTPNRSNFDVSFFKDFDISESKKIQFRTGFFNIFNQAYPRNIDTGNVNNSDIFLTLQTQCNVTVAEVPNGAGGVRTNVCDPTKGYHFAPDTLSRFGQVTNKRGRRIVEFALKFYF